MGRGTPAYMAPEMLQRKGDARSDVYSLGAMLFEVLSGSAPFQGDSEWEVLRKHESEPVVFPDVIPRVGAAVHRARARQGPGRGGSATPARCSQAFDALTGRRAGAPAPRRPSPADVRCRRSGRAEHAPAPRRHVGDDGRPPRRAAPTRRSAASATEDPRALGLRRRDGGRGTRRPNIEAHGGARRRRRRRPSAPPRRRGLVGRVVRAPFRVVGWVFSNLLTVVATLFIAGGADRARRSCPRSAIG